jgi:stage V sporulation protein G
LHFLLIYSKINYSLDIILKKGGETMQITDVRVRKINSEGKMKAIVSVTFDDCFVVHDIKIIDGQNGPFIAMPSRKMPDGEFKDIAHPINSETRAMIQDAVFASYEEKLAEEEE